MRFIWIFALVCVGLLCAQPPVRCRGPLSEEQVADLIGSHVPEARVELYVRTCGISFQVTGAAAARLRAAGAPAALISLLEERAPKNVPAIEEFTASPRTVLEGAEAELRWRVKNADSLELQPGIGRVPAEGSEKVKPQSTTTYRLAAAGAGGPKTAEVTVEVAKRPRIVKFDANPSSIRAGEQTVLSWETENADSVEIDGGIGEVISAGKWAVGPRTSTTYSLRARRLGVEVKGTVHVEVLGPAAGAGGPKTTEATVDAAKRARIVKFEAHPARVQAGEEIILSWQIENADSVEITGGVGQVSATGSRAVKPVSSGNYTVTARRLGVEVKGKAEVQVLGPALAGASRIEFVRIPAGEFMMGSEKGDTDEKPVHRVRITKAFEIGKDEVTQAQWGKVMGSSLSYFKGADRPMESVSWNDVQDFLRKLNAANDGYRYRLPTEAEWEYAARAGSTADVADLDSAAWHQGNAGNETHVVGTKRPNAWGLYDMTGNVWELCQDLYDGDYYRNSPETDPPGPVSGQTRVLRGGAWFGPPNSLRAAYRERLAPADWGFRVGFRLVREGGRAGTAPGGSADVVSTIPWLGAKVVGIKFYESGPGYPAVKDRKYFTRFRSSETRYINWEIGLSYPVRSAPESFTLEVLWYGPNGSVLTRQSFDATLKAGRSGSLHTLGWGNKSAGAFTAGRYQIDILLKGQVIARGVFEVY